MPGRIGRAIMIGCFALFVLFLYGPTITIVILSFQGPSGGLTFPMRGVSLHWFGNLFEKQMVGDFAGSFERSMIEQIFDPTAYLGSAGELVDRVLATRREVCATRPGKQP